MYANKSFFLCLAKHLKHILPPQTHYHNIDFYHQLSLVDIVKFNSRKCFITPTSFNIVKMALVICNKTNIWKSMKHVIKLSLIKGLSLINLLFCVNQYLKSEFLKCLIKRLKTGIKISSSKRPTWFNIFDYESQDLTIIQLISYILLFDRR